MEAADELLVRRAQHGDLAAFKELVDKYKQRVYATACQITRNHSDADDVAQETFIRAYKALGGFKGGASFYTWLYRIMVNRCIDYMRKRRRRGETDLEEAGGAEVSAAAYEGGAKILSPVREAEENELRGAIAAALETLPAKHRLALVLHEFDGIPHRDIAEMMKCSEGTVRSRLHYARAKMQQKLRRFIE